MFYQFNLGLKYSLEDDSFVFGENLPAEWSFMEFNVPVMSADGEEEWVVARVDRRGEDTKVVRVEGSPFTTTVVRAWTQGAELVSSHPGQENRERLPPVGHTGWVFTQGSNATVEIILK